MAKATKKQALGRGLSALLSDPNTDINSAQDKNADQVIGQVINLALDRIQVNPFQPRTHFDEQQLQELSQSIKELGVIQPITVRKTDFNTFQLVSGERRYRACRLAGVPSIPAYVRIANDQESLEMALVENIQRQDLDAIEIALSYQRLMDEVQLTQEMMALRVGKQRSTIANYLRLLQLDPIVQSGIRDGFITMGHGKALAHVTSAKQQIQFYERIVEKNLSVRATEAMVQQQNTHSTAKTPKSGEYATQQAALSHLWGTPVSIQDKGAGKGTVTFSFKSVKELEELTKKFIGES
jgi:ParB family chromosome partitioning protein